jgi:hypothetical protein
VDTIDISISVACFNYFRPTKFLLLSGGWNGWCESNPGLPFRLSHSWALADFFDIGTIEVSMNVHSGKMNENGNSGTIPPAELNNFLSVFLYRHSPFLKFYRFLHHQQQAYVNNRNLINIQLWQQQAQQHHVA